MKWLHLYYDFIALEVNVKTAGLQDNGRFENYSPTSCIVCEEAPSQWESSKIPFPLLES